MLQGADACHISAPRAPGGCIRPAGARGGEWEHIFCPGGPTALYSTPSLACPATTHSHPFLTSTESLGFTRGVAGRGLGGGVRSHQGTALSSLRSVVAVNSCTLPPPPSKHGREWVYSNLSDCIVFQALVRWTCAPSSP